MQSRGNPMEWTVKSVISIAFGVGIGLYFVYRLWPSPKYHVHPHHVMTWKNKDFSDIPNLILKDSKLVKPELKKSEYDLENGQHITLYYRIVEPISGSKRKPIDLLFLHGNAFNSEDWQNINSLQIMAAAGYRCFALDLPSGKRSSSSSTRKIMSSKDKVKFLTHVVMKLGIKRPLIISPSMSGSYSIPFIMESNPLTCKDRLSGFLPIAPVGTDDYRPNEYHRCHVPVMIVYGSKDKELGLESTGNLRNMPNREIFPILGAKHACYKDDPQLFNKYLYNFAEEVVTEELMSDD